MTGPAQSVRLMTPQSHTVTLPDKRPVIELLLCCARTRMEPGTTERVRQLLKEEIDWNYLSQSDSTMVFCRSCPGI